jgi:uncharacterized RDD family membrane protein YckC
MTEGGISPIPREARPYQGQRAGLVTRSLAAAIDALVVGVLLLAGYLGLNGLRFVVSPRRFHFIDTSSLPVLTIALGVSILYLASVWAATGRSYGCHVLGLRVVDRRGRHPRPLTALVRAGLCVFVPVGLLWCVVGRNRRSLQDVVLRTSVVYDWRPRATHGRDLTDVAV